MKIIILTYDGPHTKTTDLANSLWRSGDYDMTLLPVKWIERSPHNPYLQHRPAHNNGRTPLELKEFPGCKILTCDNYKDVRDRLNRLKYDVILIGGARILPPDLINQHKIINSHPGWLPNVRGLDALKWAIWDDQPIGVTTHYVGEEADTGILIDRQETALYPDTTFQSLARLHYNLEIDMLVKAVEDVKTLGKTEELGKQYIYRGEFPSSSGLHRRMPQAKEKLIEAILTHRLIENREALHHQPDIYPFSE